MMLWLCLLAFIVIIVRAIWVFAKLGDGLSLGARPARILAVAGSGGHTSELIRLMDVLSPSKYRPRYYVVADTDRMSTTKIKNFELNIAGIPDEDYFIVNVPRSREVAQPWVSSLWTTLVATLYSFPIIWKADPDLILCNGPGTCIPLCLIGLIYKFLGFSNVQIIFVESICRVESLSLSGLILYRLADKIFVQWPQLQQKYPRSLYLGRIV